MAERNQHGLGRYVPMDIRREIRTRCGFGCVICGLAYYDYEHFDPDFKDAKGHSANGMTLLCMQCNQKRARGTLSADTVARANANPKCRQQGFASEVFDFGLEPIEVKIGGASFIDCGTLIQVRGVDILSFKPPTEPNSPFLLSGLLSDVTGATTLRIVDNEWFAGDENWDVHVIGPLITIRRGPGDIALQIRVMPPHSLVIERIDMQIEGYFIRGEEDILKLSPDGRNWNSLQIFSLRSCGIGIKIE